MNVKELFKEAVKRNASDVHLVVNMPPIARIDGELANLD